MHRLQRTSVAPLPRYESRGPRHQRKGQGKRLLAPLLMVLLAGTALHLAGVMRQTTATGVGTGGTGGGLQPPEGGGSTDRQLVEQDPQQQQQQQQPGMQEQQDEGEAAQQQQQEEAEAGDEERQAPPTPAAVVDAPPREGSTLQGDLAALVQEAAMVAKDLGIQTDASLAGVPFGPDEAEPGELGPCTEGGCGAHGSCEEGRCRCTALYAGVRCAHALYLSWPFRPQELLTFNATFEGEVLLHKGMRHSELTVWGRDLPPDKRRLVADAATVQKLMGILPGEDSVVKGRAYRSCAVVGSSGSLLLHKLGAKIDSHTVVLRFNAAPTVGYEEHVGSKTSLRLTSDAFWGFREGPGEVVLVHSQSIDALRGLAWNVQQPQPASILAFDPDFEDWVQQSLRFEPDSGAYGILLALQACSSVTLYGFGQLGMSGVPYLYYDHCDQTGFTLLYAQHRVLIRLLSRTGLARYGEPCTTDCISDMPEGPDKCANCRRDKGLAAGVAAVCDSAKRPPPYRVPWKAAAKSA